MANANYGSNAWYRRKLEVGKAFCEDLLSEKVTSMDEYILQTTDEMQKPYSRGVSIGVGVFLYMETLCVIKKRRIVDKLFATPKMSKVRLFSVFGGIPYYNRLIDAQKRVRENIIELIASSGARLENEVAMYLNSEISKITRVLHLNMFVITGYSFKL